MASRVALALAKSAYALVSDHLRDDVGSAFYGAGWAELLADCGEFSAHLFASLR